MQSVYPFAIPYLEDAVGGENGQVSFSFSAYVRELNLISNGVIQQPLSEQEDWNEGDVLPANPIPTFVVSNLAYTKYQNLFNPNNSDVKSGGMKESSLVRRYLKAEPSDIDKNLSLVVRAIFLESYSLYKALENPKELFKYISERDIRIIIENIRWATKKLFEGYFFDYELLVEFRWLERAFKYVEQSDELFNAEFNSEITRYNNVRGGVGK
ncbi:hypothetical protein M3_0013 [Lysinibacillus phage vB_LfM_LysYB1]|nr:hypothetical protein M3_0013 [Lysinibacillus phage vB_LfM_LysYB1]WAB25244.1 hypothetical protein M5_0066 [Lysinibacillus phage vB_LfM_LysYB2]